MCSIGNSYKDENHMSKEYLKQIELIEFLSKKHGEDTWVSVYKNLDNETQYGILYCGLIPKTLFEKAIDDFNWEVSIGSGAPGFITRFNGGEQVSTYYRNPSFDGSEHLVIYRAYEGFKENEYELVEEFRLFHNLVYDSTNHKYVKVFEDGEFEDAVIQTTDEIKIKLKMLKQYLAAKQMHLCLYFDNMRYFTSPLSSKEIDELDFQIRYSNLVLDRYAGNLNLDDKNSFSRILGKKIITCGDITSCGLYPYEKTKSYQDFIIAEDNDGNELYYNCNPDNLSNYFGANPEAPHYLTPIFFKKEVLSKYYSDPSKYSVSDSSINSTHWILRLDNNNKDYIIVFLGDLGRDLPEKEQVYWKSFNIVPQGKMSETYFKRSMLGEFTDPESEDLIFKMKFESFTQNWKRKENWNLLLPLEKKDIHLFTTLRIPLSNNQKEFDEQILALAKILVDSINEKKIKEIIGEESKDISGIGLLEMFFAKKGCVNFEEHIEFLRALYNLRSSGTGHRKGKKYEKAIKKIKIVNDDLVSSMRNILKSCIDFLEYLNRQT